MKKIIVIGGGAAGMMAAIAAAEAGAEVTLIEKNDRLGKKLFLTGKGRCNLTNAGDADRFFSSLMTNRKFMYRSFYAFPNTETISFFEASGLSVKTERGDRVFPASDHSSDVIGVLKTRLRRNPRVDVRLQTEAKDLLAESYRDGMNQRKFRVTGVLLKDGRSLPADAVILATGGLSYPSTGSTGDGYRFAKRLGHTVETPAPSLVPFRCKDDFCRECMGLSLKNIAFVIKFGKKTVFDEQGELLFTHFGVSGPLVLKASAGIHRYIGKDLHMYINLKPALTAEQLDDRLLRDFRKYANKDFHNALTDFLPLKLIDVIVRRSGIDPHKKVHSVTKEERLLLAETIRHLTLTWNGLRGFEEAIVTKGGVNVREIDPSTMESKLAYGLYFAGEVIDVDALTGGFNLQVAWSTGHLAGESCAGQGK